MSNTLSIVIAEDELIWARELEILLHNLGYAVAAVFDDTTDALAGMNDLSFDLALLDIRMNGKNTGIALGKTVGSVYNKPFIFITGGTEKNFIQEAIAARPSAFLTKPVTEAALYAAIQTALDNFAEKKTAIFSNANPFPLSFFVKTGSKYKKVDWEDVTCLSVDGRYTKILLQNDTNAYLIGSSLNKTISSILPFALQSHFIQISRTEFVHLEHIEELNGKYIKTRTHQFDLSENFSKAVKEKLNIIS